MATHINAEVCHLRAALMRAAIPTLTACCIAAGCSDPGLDSESTEAAPTVTIVLVQTSSTPGALDPTTNGGNSTANDGTGATPSDNHASEGPVTNDSGSITVASPTSAVPNGNEFGSSNGPDDSVDGAGGTPGGGATDPSANDSGTDSSGIAETPDGGALPATDPEPMVPVEPATDPLNAAETCTSNDFWRGGEGETMRPGEACVACHTASDEGPRYAIAGTLYPTGHEPNDCNGADSSFGAIVVITDADGAVHELDVNSAGNFFLRSQIALPYTASVVSADGERRMVTPQQVGDCNTCHTQGGLMGAPGRIVIPYRP